MSAQTIKAGDPVPRFTLKDQNNKAVSIKDLIGKPFVVYFYPKDDTPGCTVEACSFRDQFEEFRNVDATIIGISADSPSSHKDFAEKYRLPFTLLSDEENEVRDQFGVPKSFLGLLPGRTTYIIDKEGIVRHVFNSQLKPKQHVQEAIDFLKNNSSDK